MTTQDIQTLIARNGAAVIARVALLLGLAQIALGIIEQLRGRTPIYQGLILSSSLVFAMVWAAKRQDYSRRSLHAFVATLATLFLADRLGLSPWLEFPPVAAGMGSVILLQQIRQAEWSIVAFLATLLLVAIGNAVTVSGMTTSAIWFLPIGVMTAGFVLDRAQGRAFAVICLIVVGGLGMAAEAGWLAPHMLRSTWYYVAVIGTLIVCAAILGISSMERYRLEFAKSRALSERLTLEIGEATLARTRLQAVFEANPLPSTIVDADGRLLDCNQAWQATTGIAKADAVGRSSVDLGVWTVPEDYLEIQRRIRSDGCLRGVATQINTADGVREMLVYLQPLGLADSDQRVTILYDQTDRLAAEAAQRELNEELERRVTEANAKLTSALQDLAQSERLASLGSTVAGIAHELNTPLGNARTVAGTMRDLAHEMQRALEEERMKKSALKNSLHRIVDMAELVDRSAQRAADLIAGYKQLAIEQTSESRREFELQAAVAGVVAIQAAAGNGPRCELRSAIPPGIRCHTYPAPLGQVLSALLHNATTHAFDGHDHAAKPGHIEVDASSDGGTVRLQVRDNGVGMDSPTLAKIFDPFFTTRLGQGGSGLGLAIAHRIATKVLAGRLSAISTPGEGSCFTLEFPCVAPGRI